MAHEPPPGMDRGSSGLGGVRGAKGTGQMVGDGERGSIAGSSLPARSRLNRQPASGWYPTAPTSIAGSAKGHQRASANGWAPKKRAASSGGVPFTSGHQPGLEPAKLNPRIADELEKGKELARKEEERKRRISACEACGATMESYRENEKARHERRMAALQSSESRLPPVDALEDNWALSDVGGNGCFDAVQEHRLSDLFKGLTVSPKYEITAEAAAKYKAAMMAPRDRLLVELNAGMEVSGEHIKCLIHGQWLNDEVINCYMKLLQERDGRMRERGTLPKAHFFNSFFLEKLYNPHGGRKYNYKAVQKWTGKGKLKRWGQACDSVLDCDLLVFPVHLGAHWTCAAANLKEQRLIYMDSFHGVRRDILDVVGRYISDEAMDKGKRAIDTSGWSREYPAVPRQENGCDCGVFATQFASFVGAGQEMDFTQENMKYFRIQVTNELLAKRIDVP
ncbi:unnamed protein product [Ostreobium quekettii]|uniref:Ubiquitin-like protease family profile domain-containing protein n=1 Tax=Ostreobium quekettii TaxID=121088 RepID=A0A8S1JCJ2_9CHLO|nr:unnamed protein product [Ostreobium quekettii]